LNRKLPGILITGNTNRKTRQELENKGFHFMAKPVDADELLKTVRSAAKACGETQREKIVGSRQ
jgi:DNA-binding NtrC family response regulator